MQADRRAGVTAVLLFTDGLANHGVTDASLLENAVRSLVDDAQPAIGVYEPRP